MLTRFPVIILSAAVAFGAVGCDDNGDDSPTVTYTGGAVGGELDQPDQPAEQPSQTDDATRPDASPAAATNRHVADLPEGTDDQQARLIEGRTAFLNNRYEEAAEIFEPLALDEPVSTQTVSAAVALGQIYLETGRSQQALELFEQLEDHVEDIPEVLLVLARTYESLDHPRRAVDTYEKAFRQKPDYVFILPEMAQILIREGDEERAAQVLVDYEANITELVNHLEDTDDTSEAERLWIVDIFSMVSDERAHQALETALRDDPSDTVRAQAAVALGDSAAFDSRELLEQTAVDDQSEPVRRGARQALDTLRDYEEQFEQMGQ